METAKELFNAWWNLPTASDRWSVAWQLTDWLFHQWWFYIPFTVLMLLFLNWLMGTKPQPNLTAEEEDRLRKKVERDIGVK